MAAHKNPRIKKLLTQLEKAKQKANLVEVILVGNILIREQVKIVYEMKLKRPASEPGLKFNSMLEELLGYEIASGDSSVKVTSKKNMKAVKLWKVKFDAFFKSLKKDYPLTPKTMADETLQIAAMLQTTITRL